MKWFTYIRRTPLAQIRTDIKEYQALWRQYFALRAAKSTAHQNIIDVVDGDRENRKAEPACIRQEYFFTPTMVNHSNDNNDSMMCVRNTVCCHMKKNKTDEKCDQTDCPRVQRNHDFFDACARLDMVRRARRNFWRNKFANVKTK